MAATDHVEHWKQRFVADSTLDRDLASVAQRDNRERDSPQSVARGLQLRLPAGSRLWLRPEHFESTEPRRIARALDVASLGV